MGIRIIKEVIAEFEKHEKERWDDAEHCTCLAGAIVDIKVKYGLLDEDKEHKKWMKKMKEINKS